MNLVNYLRKEREFFIILTSDTTKAINKIVEQIKLSQCENAENFEPCNSCPKCIHYVEQTYPYYFKISKEPHRQKISIEQIRELENYFYMKVEDEYKKYFFIEDAGYLSSEAQNHLLKVLEEIPSNTFFFFICTTLNDVLPTILSRAKKIFIEDRELSLDSECPSNIKTIGQKVVDFWLSNKKKDITLYEYLKESIVSDKKLSYQQKKNTIKLLLEILYNKIFQQSRQNISYLYFLDEIVNMIIELKYNITLELFVMNLYIKLLKWKSLMDE